MVRIRQSAAYDADVLIVGAGPAGASAAHHLARDGVSVILLDRKVFPRDKVCGDFVGPVAVQELERLGIADWPEFQETLPVRFAALHVDGKEVIRQAIPRVEGLPSTGRVIPREVLDEWIYRAAVSAGAGAETANVVDIVPGADGVRVRGKTAGQEREWFVRLVIGADGAGSLVSRTLHRGPPSDDDRIIAVRAYYEGVEGAADTCDLYFSNSSFPGYYWLFPTGEGTANVGIGMVLKTHPPTEDHLRELLMDHVEQDPALNAKLRHAIMKGKVAGWPLTTYNPRKRLSGSRLVLTGDAAGLINPLNGEGIQYAMLSGRWVAETVQACLNTGDFSDRLLACYDQRVERELGYDMALAGTIVQFIRNRSLNTAWLSSLKAIVARARRDDAYARIVGGILAGMVPASEAVSLRVVCGTASQALISSAWAVGSRVVRGPEAVMGLATDVAGVVAGTIVDAANNPVRFAEWGYGVARSATNLAGHVATSTMRSQRRRSAPRPKPLPL